MERGISSIEHTEQGGFREFAPNYDWGNWMHSVVWAEEHGKRSIFNDGGRVVEPCNKDDLSRGRCSINLMLV